jgi:hypothetical protein
VLYHAARLGGRVREFFCQAYFLSRRGALRAEATA